MRYNGPAQHENDVGAIQVCRTRHAQGACCLLVVAKHAAAGRAAHPLTARAQATPAFQLPAQLSGWAQHLEPALQTLLPWRSPTTLCRCAGWSISLR